MQVRIKSEVKKFDEIVNGEELLSTPGKVRGRAAESNYYDFELYVI